MTECVTYKNYRFTPEEAAELYEILCFYLQVGGAELVKRRTKKQNGSLHRWCRQCAEVLKQSDLEYTAIVQQITEKGVGVMWDEDAFKHLFRATLHQVYGIESTADADTKQYNKIYEAFVRLFGGNGVTLPPWPQEEGNG